MSILSNRSVDPPHERAAYAAAVLDLLGSRDPVAVIKDTPAALDTSIAGLSRQALGMVIFPPLSLLLTWYQMLFRVL